MSETPPWQKRRGAFNHDWLKNQFLPALRAFVRLLKGEVEDSDLEVTFLRDVLPTWPGRIQQLGYLLDDFEGQMSPQMLLEQSPLSRCDEATRQWLAPLAHALWLARIPIARWTDQARARAKEADSAYQQLYERLRQQCDPSSAAAAKPLAADFEVFRQACVRLTKAIEEFPDRVLVT